MRLAGRLIQVPSQQRGEQEAADGGRQVHHAMVAGKVRQPKELRGQHLHNVMRTTGLSMAAGSHAA